MEKIKVHFKKQPKETGLRAISSGTPETLILIDGVQHKIFRPTLWQRIKKWLGV
ncbi:MAG: hypothetical protein LBU87_03355 [Lactobacillales bacterium]|jgi:hypothetical protein|nr:hypothetical protein [Lactobacillales bacterium]